MNADTIIEFTMSMHSFAVAVVRESATVGEWTGLTQLHLDTLPSASVNEALDKAFADWQASQYDGGWSIKPMTTFQIGIGSIVSPGRKESGSWVRLGGDFVIVGETPCYWIDAAGNWWSKSTLKRSPVSPTGLQICAVVEPKS